MNIRTSSDLGALIRDRRKNLGIDQALLAQKAGTSRQWIVAAEQGKPRAEIGLILRTLAALGLSVNVTDNTSSHRNRRANADKERPPIDINRIIASLRTPR
jgi:HTH-type transcriptional regulator/antitoxin HipB